MLENKPTVGAEYNHNNGITYKVLYIANENSTKGEYSETVVYQGENGKIWTKTVENFMLKMNETNEISWDKFLEDFRNTTDNLDRAHIGNYMSAFENYVKREGFNVPTKNKISAKNK